MDIAVDLLPHALSLVVSIYPNGQIGGIDGFLQEKRTFLNFDYSTDRGLVRVFVNLEMPAPETLAIFGFENFVIERKKNSGQAS